VLSFNISPFFQKKKYSKDDSKEEATKDYCDMRT
jgi:hypothetical protein